MVRPLCAAACLAVLPAQADDEPEFAPFRLTDWDGALSLNHFVDRSTLRLGGGDSALEDTRAALKLALNARGFVYHPNLLALEAGIGVAVQRSRFVVEAGAAGSDTRDTRGLYDFSLRGTLLRDKPYTGLLFYEHLNPTVTVGPAIVVLQENTRFGGQFAWLAPSTPVPLNVEAERLHARGSGSDRLVDDRTDRYALGAETAIARLGSVRLRLDGSRLDSRSGVVGLPITQTVTRSASAGLDTRLQWGEDSRYQLTALMVAAGQRYELGERTPADRIDWRSTIDLRARHSPELLTYVNYNGTRVEQGSLASRTLNPRVGLTWWPSEQFSSTLELRGETVRTTEFASRSHGSLMSFDVRAPLAGGRAQVGYSASLDTRSQSATATATPVIGERHVLAGIGFVALDRTDVVPGSVTVGNEARTQVYVEGRDYLLSALGAQTRLQRIVGGAITDGETVLVDYGITTGGTFDSTLLVQNLGLSWAWSNRFSVYARRQEITPDVTAGVPLFVFNTVRSTTLGLQFAVPAGNLLTLGGSLEREDRRETILPARRTSGDLYAQWDDAFLGPGSIRLGARRQRVRYEVGTQDVDLAGYELRYRVLTEAGVELQADWSTESDTGSLIDRRRDHASLLARWRFRQLTMSLSATQVRESQDGLRSTRTIGQLVLRREF